MTERKTGTVKWFDVSKGYGYIDSSLGEDVFVHYKSITGRGFQNLFAGDKVEFAVDYRPSGPIALEVTRI